MSRTRSQANHSHQVAHEMLFLLTAPASFAPNSVRSPTSIVGRHVSTSMMATPNAAAIYDGEYKDELVETATAMIKAGKGYEPLRVARV